MEAVGVGQDVDLGDPAPRTVNARTETGRPPGAAIRPAAPFTRTGRAEVASQAKPRAAPATASAPRTSRDVPARSARSTTSGSSTASRASRSPPRAAARKASTTARWRARSASGTAAAPRTRRRARLASWRAAATERPSMPAISSNGTPNRSWSTNASRSAGVRVSSTTSRAKPTPSATSAWCSGSAPSGRVTTGSGRRRSSGSSRRDARARSMSSDTRATTVVSQPPRLSTPVVPVRLSRSQASWTASSASAREPSIR